MSILKFFRQKFCHGATLPTFLILTGLLSLQTPRAREKSCQAVVRSTVGRQSTFLSISCPGPRRVLGEAGS